jgi:hypothetical protein
LQRTTRSVTLTDIGARYLERARRILGDVEEAEISAQAERTQPSGRLVVSAPIGFGRIHVSPVMSAYLQRYPDVSGELRLSDRMINLVEDGVDLAVRIGHLADSSLVARSVGDMRRIVVASPDYLKRRGEPNNPAAVLSHDAIQFGTSDWDFVEDGREVPTRPPAPSRPAGSESCWRNSSRLHCLSTSSIRPRGCYRPRCGRLSIWWSRSATGSSGSDDVPRTQRSTPPFAAWCAAEPGPYRTPVFGTVPVLRSSVKNAASRPGHDPTIPSSPRGTLHWRARSPRRRLSQSIARSRSCCRS